MPADSHPAAELLRQSTKLMTDSWLLALDSAAVVWLRLGRLAAMDGAALAESELMVTEKALAAVELPWRVLTGGFGTSPQAIAQQSLSFYRTRVSANRRRLSRRP